MQTTKHTPSPWLRLLTAMSVISVAVPGTAFAQGATAPADAAKPAAEAAAPAATPTPAPVTPEPAPATGDALEDDILVLTPFTVDAKKDRGYFAENTLAGSRMRTKLSDLGSSISVVNIAQMEDFASTDTNDVFRYDVNTEGSLTYTPQVGTMRGDGVLDVNAGGTQGNVVGSFTNAGANRVRGLGVPSAAINYYPSIGAIPPDAYNTQSIEISRGPNSMLFGVGSPAGMVNQSTQQAMLGRNFGKATVRFDDRGSYRTSIAYNQQLIDNKLSIFGALLWDNKRFERKPSYDDTRRIYGALTYKPFSKLTLRANFEDYNNKNRRPNTISPIDLVTQWNLAGRPTYDALTKRFTFLSTGEVKGPYVSSNSSTLNATANAQQVRNYIISMPGYNPALRNTTSDTTFTTYNGVTIFGQNAITTIGSALYVPGVAQMNQGRTRYQIMGGQVWNWYQPLYGQGYRSAWTVPPAAAAPLSNNPESNMWNSALNSDIYNRDGFQSAGWTNVPAVSNIGNYRYAGITDRSIYDWKEININEANFGREKNQNYSFDVDLQITDDLFFNGGWFRQDFSQKTNYTIAQLNATAVAIDINRYLPSGEANPFFGLPYVTDRDPDQYRNAQVDDHFRGMLAYTPDFTKNAGWTRWLGRHQMIAGWSRDESMAVSKRMRLHNVAAGSQAAAFRYLPNPLDFANGTRTGWSYTHGSAVTDRMFYLANPGDPMGKVTRSSGTWDAETYSGNVQVFNYATGQFENVGLTQSFIVFNSPTRTQRIIDSGNLGLTSYLWNDRLVTTFGLRADRFRARQTTTGAITWDDGTAWGQLLPWDNFLPNGYFNESAMWNRFNKWFREGGTTKTGGGVLRPFTGWSQIESRARNGNQFWQFVRNFGISYNWANNFDPPLGPQNDAFGKRLPNAFGVGRDIGFQFEMLDGKLYARVTWFNASSYNQRMSGGSGTSAGTAMSRFNSNVDTTLFRNWARTIAVINRGDPTRSNPTNSGVGAGQFDTGWSPTEQLEIEAATEAIWQQSYNYYGSLPGSITNTMDINSKGMEIQVNYNTSNWRNRFTFSKVDAKNTQSAKQFDAWAAQRLPIMQSANAATFMTPAARALYTQGDGSIAYNSFGNTDPTPNVNLTNFWTSYGFRSEVRLNDAFGNTNVANYYTNNVTPHIQLAKDLEGQSAPNQRKFRLAYNTGYDFDRGFLKGIGIGGAQRYESKSIIGYYGRPSRANTSLPNLLDLSDTSRPIYDKANYYTDLFVKYRRKFGTKLNWTLQLNVDNVFENGSLQTVAVNYDGSPYGYRIIDSRRFVLTSTFEF